ncbi:MAG: AI-2E family transporter [Erysipelotrichaceae bacterium]|nr:AI-2E family transporter [Erysipelotrichaceae bacterium]
MINKKIWKIIEPWVYLIAIAFLFLLLVLKFDNVYLFVIRILKIFTPLYYGLGIAFVLNVPMKTMEEFIYKKYPNIKYKRFIRPLTILVSILLVLVIVSIAAILIVPQLTNSIITLLSNLEGYIQNIITYINTILEGFGSENRIYLEEFSKLPWDQYIDQVLTNFEAMVNAYGDTVLHNVKGFTSTLGNIFMGVMLSLYLLSGKEQFIAQAKRTCLAVFGPSSSAQILRVAHNANEIFGNFIGGQLVEMLVLGTLFYIGLTLFNMPYALLISVITGISGIIPILGAMIAMAFGFVVILAISPMKAIWFIVLFQCLQQFENNVIYPKIVGKSVGLQGIWVLLAIILFGDLFGAMGMIVAVPSMAVLYGLAGEFVADRIQMFHEKELIPEDIE